MDAKIEDGIRKWKITPLKELIHQRVTAKTKKVPEQKVMPEKFTKLRHYINRSRLEMELITPRGESCKISYHKKMNKRNWNQMMQEYYGGIPTTNIIIEPTLKVDEKLSEDKKEVVYVTRPKKKALFKTEYLDSKIFKIEKDGVQHMKAPVTNNRMNELAKLSLNECKFTINLKRTPKTSRN